MLVVKGFFMLGGIYHKCHNMRRTLFLDSNLRYTVQIIFRALLLIVVIENRSDRVHEQGHCILVFFLGCSKSHFSVIGMKTVQVYLFIRFYLLY